MATTKAMTPAEVLAQVYHLFDDHKKWTRGTLARNQYSNEVDVHNPSAVRFCAVGAIRYVAGHTPISTMALAELEQTTGRLYEKSVISTNDEGPGGRKKIREALRQTVLRLAPEQQLLPVEKEERVLAGAPR